MTRVEIIEAEIAAAELDEMTHTMTCTQFWARMELHESEVPG